MLLMFQWFLSHASSSKECSLAFMTSETSKNMKTFAHMKLVTTTMRTSKSNRCIQSRQLPPPQNNRPIVTLPYNLSISMLKYICIWNTSKEFSHYYLNLLTEHSNSLVFLVLSGGFLPSLILEGENR